MKHLTALALLAATVTVAATPAARAADTAEQMKTRLLAVVPLPFPPPARAASAGNAPAAAVALGAGRAATPPIVPHVVSDPSCPSCPPRIEVPSILPFRN